MRAQELLKARLQLPRALHGLCFRIIDELSLRYSLGTPPLSNSWIIFIIWLSIALNRTPH